MGESRVRTKEEKSKREPELGPIVTEPVALGFHVLPVVVFYCQILSRLPSAPGSVGLGIIQCDIQSDIHPVLLPAPLCADEIRVVSVETGSSMVAGTRHTSPRK